MGSGGSKKVMLSNLQRSEKLLFVSLRLEDNAQRAESKYY